MGRNMKIPLSITVYAEGKLLNEELMFLGIYPNGAEKIQYLQEYEYQNCKYAILVSEYKVPVYPEMEATVID